MPNIRRTAIAGFFLAGAASLCVAQPALAQRSRTCRVREVNLAPTDVRVGVNSTSPVLATAYDAAGNPCDNVTYTWSSSNNSVATVDRGGIVHGVSLGTARITARTGNGAAAKIGTANVTVEEASADITNQNAGGGIDSSLILHRREHGAGQGMAALDRQADGTGPADNLQVEPVSLVLIRGERKALEFHALRADGQPAAPVPIVFQVAPGGERIATVDTFGFVTALTDTGTATLNLTVPGQSRIQPRVVRVSVKSDPVVFNHPELTLAPGMVETLTVWVPNQSRALTPQLFQYTSSDASKLQVNPGLPILTAVAPGNVRVTATNAFVPDFYATVHIHRRVRSIAIAPADRPVPPDTTVIVPIGGSVTLQARALAADDGSPVPEATINWRVPDMSAIQLDTARGIVRGLRSGLATLFVSTQTSRDSVATAMIRVKVVAGGLYTSRARIGLPVGERTPVDVTLLDEQHNSAGSALPYITWSSTDTTVAHVEANGQLVAHGRGHATIRGRTGWDSVVTIEAWGIGDLIAFGRHEGRAGLLMFQGNTLLGRVGDDSLVEYANWSPDLTRIAYTATVNPTSREPSAALFLMNADGSGRVRLTADDSSVARYPSFVPGVSGMNSIVYEWNRGGRAQVWRADVRNDSLLAASQLTSNPSGNTAPTVSADGHKIAYVSVRETSPGRRAYELYTAGIDGADERRVISLPQGYRISGAPVFSRDGTHLLFVRTEPVRNNLPTQRVVRIPVSPAPTDTVVAITPIDRVVQSFSLSADGQTLALHTLEQLQNGYNRHLVLFALPNGPATSLDTPDMRPANPAFRPAATPPAAGGSH